MSNTFQVDLKSIKFIPNFRFNASYNEFISYKDQKNFVASVLYLEPTNDFPEGLVITGGNDSVILIYKPSEHFATCSIKEHSNTGIYHSFCKVFKIT